MQNRIIDISSDSVHLNVERGFICMTRHKQALGRICLEDVSGVVIRGYGATFSANLCSRLANAKIPLIICGTNQTPSSVLWPVDGHFAQGLIMQAQASANKPLNKRLWQALVKAKIKAQAEITGFYTLPNKGLLRFSQLVKSGDVDNIEAQAAKLYWSMFFDDAFKRDRKADGVNAALNYGYTVLRAATSRSILAAGLHPSLSIHHKSRGDALRLSDDLMEPFRPYIDWVVRRIWENHKIEDLSPEIKAQIVSVLGVDLKSNAGTSPLQTCIDHLAQSLSSIYQGDEKQLSLPQGFAFEGSQA